MGIGLVLHATTHPHISKLLDLVPEQRQGFDTLAHFEAATDPCSVTIVHSARCLRRMRCLNPSHGVWLGSEGYRAWMGCCMQQFA
jgi:hypothetical protein